MNATLQHLLSPRSIAIVGASADFNRINGRALKFLLDKGYGGRIYPINPKYASIAGLTCYPDAAALPEAADLAIVAVPAARVCAAITDLGERGIDAAIVFSSGFAEMGEQGARLQSDLQETARAAGVRICGPNCLGLINAFDRVMATFGQFADGPVPPGPVAFVTQSGAFGTAIAALARRRHLGLGYFVNTGNESDFGFAEVMEHVLADERIRVGAGYIEGLKDGEALVRAARRALRLGKPLVVTKVGRTPSGARAAISHTGSLAGEDKVFSGIARQFGIVRARNEEHLLDLAEAFTYCGLPRGKGVGVVTQSGGAGVLMVDRAVELGLDVPLLAAATIDALRAAIPGFGIAANPVDITGQFVAEPQLLERSVTALLSDPAIDIALVWIQLMDAHVDVLLEIFRGIKARAHKPFIVSWVAAPERAIQGLHAAGIAVLRGAEPAIDAVAGLVEYAASRSAWLEQAAAQTEPAPTLPPLPPAPGQVSSLVAASLLAAVGVPLVPVTLASSAEEAARVARSFERPAALKIESPDIAHKTDAGGVRLGLDSDSAIRAAFEDILSAVAQRHPHARIDGVAVQPMAPAGTELVIGLKRDPVFGAVVMVGLGGLLIEVLQDAVFRKCPLSPLQAAAMLEELRGRMVLDGVRGRPPLSRAQLADLIARVAGFGAALGPRLRELDLNPVIGAGAALFAVDWLLVLD
ncbi:MAG: acetate--CoA ligase family protein [Burkholderiales bacterium]|nr:acetate--CoA ligase family protein [Burkholderiales bacterium]